MDSQSRAFESSHDSHLLAAGTPLRCPRPMVAQPVVVWTPARVLGALFSVILSVPRAALMAPAVIRTTRNRRA
ncbi:MAG TPA: hypothetical protein VGC16_05340 [Rhizomicrobium sp.]